MHEKQEIRAAVPGNIFNLKRSNRASKPNTAHRESTVAIAQQEPKTTTYAAQLQQICFPISIDVHDEGESSEFIKAAHRRKSRKHSVTVGEANVKLPTLNPGGGLMRSRTNQIRFTITVDIANGLGHATGGERDGSLKCSVALAKKDPAAHQNVDNSVTVEVRHKDIAWAGRRVHDR
jgi:hypothetical protein